MREPERVTLNVRDREPLSQRFDEASSWDLECARTTGFPLLVQVTADLREEQLEIGIGSEAATIHPCNNGDRLETGQYLQCRAYSFSEAVPRRPKLSEKVVLATQIVPQGRRSCDRRRRGR